MWTTVAIYIFGLLWGSFLNVVGYRIVRDISLFKRSHCLQCHTQLNWYDLIPVVSYLRTSGRCRYCKNQISLLYPVLEMTTGFLAVSIYLLTKPEYWIPYTIFYSALIVIMRSDTESCLISRYTTLLLIPIFTSTAYLNWLPVSFTASIVGTVVGYSILWIIKTSFYYLRGYEGMGEGDLDMLAMIGSFLGPYGCWSTLLIGSVIGSLVSLTLLSTTETTTDTQIPFGLFLALGAIITAHIPYEAVLTGTLL